MVGYLVVLRERLWAVWTVDQSDEKLVVKLADQKVGALADSLDVTSAGVMV